MSDINLASQTPKWEDSLIPRWERVLHSKFNIRPMYARALATTVMSAGMSTISIKNGMGIVKPNIWFGVLAESGSGKSPPLNFICSFFRYAGRVDPRYDSLVNKFTVAGLYDHICGRLDKAKNVEIPPHPTGVIVYDDCGALLGNKKFQLEFSEILSELYDGHLSSSLTRSFGREGANNVYYPFIGAATTNTFLDKMDNNFFNIGLGNRYLWVLEDPVPPTMKSEGFLFLPSINIKDELFEATLARYQELSKIKTATFSIEASDLWCEYDKELQEIRSRFNASNEGYKASYYVKRSLDTLKLSLIYAASRFEVRLIPERTGKSEPELWVAGEDMERAVDDIKNQYLPMFDKLITTRDELKSKHTRRRRTIW